MLGSSETWQMKSPLTSTAKQCINVTGDSTFVPRHPDLNNHTETILITTLLGLLAQASY